MRIIKIIEDKKNKKQIKYSQLAKELGISRQNLYYHLKNLKNHKISFSIEQIKTICDFLKIDISIFFAD